MGEKRKRKGEREINKTFLVSVRYGRGQLAPEPSPTFDVVDKVEAVILPAAMPVPRPHADDHGLLLVRRAVAGGN